MSPAERLRGRGRGGEAFEEGLIPVED